MIYELKVQLKDIKPPIWRKLRVSSGIRLDKLHMVIQEAMGWTNSHLYLFIIREELYSDFPKEWNERVIDSKEMTLKKLHDRGIKSFTYEYDMGDSWQHLVQFLKEIPSKGRVKPACIAGARACPPEDVGGAYRYETFLEAIADPQHEEHEDFVEWIGEDFDPEYFDLEETNYWVERVR